MVRALRSFLLLLLCLAVPAVCGQTAPSAAESKPSAPAKPAAAPSGNNPQEAYVIQKFSQNVRFENDGTEAVTSEESVHVLSEAGVERWGVLTFAYQNFNEALDIDYVRVKKPDGSIIVTPPEETQEITSEISRVAPFYTDQREKHVAVKGLAPGDILEYSSHLRVTKPLVPGEFWTAYEFSHAEVVNEEDFEINIPEGRAVKIKNRGPKFETVDQDGRRIYRWTYSNPKRKEDSDEDKGETWKQARGLEDQPDILLSSFASWDEVAHWYEELQRDRVQPTAEIQAKAAELTKNATDDLAKVRAIYSFVSSRYRYIGVALGRGRYQPHYASEVMDNGYGDCKDKETLLASLLKAAGFKIYPALIDMQHDVDPDVPSPGQFNHLIGELQLGDKKIWLDTTPEVAPLGFLVGPLRGKHALVVRPDSASLELTPANPEFKSSQTFEMKAKLDDSGTLTGEAEWTISGSDLEVLVRSAFRSLPMPQWKDLAQRLSYGSGFGGEVSEVSASPPEDLTQPFRVSYKYTRKEYGDWKNLRISPPLPVMSLPDVHSDKKARSTPIWLGVPGEVHFHSTVELPKSYNLEVPAKVDLKEDFAEYHALYSLNSGVLTTDRRLQFFASEIPVAAYEKYKAFGKNVNDDRDLMMQLSSTSAPNQPPVNATTTATTGEPSMNELGRTVWSLPTSSDSVAAQYENDARDAIMRNDLEGAISSLRSAVAKDPKFTRAWLLLGSMLGARMQPDDALDAFHGAVNADPTQPISYKLLGFGLMAEQKFNEAVAVWQSLIKIAPEDHDAPSNLGTVLIELKRYNEAITALEPAVKQTPDKVSLQMLLGRAYLGAGSADKARSTFQQVIKLDSSPVILNNVAYELAEQNLDLSSAKEYSERAVEQEEDAASKLDLVALKPADLRHGQVLATFWDTLGWIYFRMNDLEQAEKFLSAAWTASQNPAIGEHLGKVYEKQGKKAAAIHVYQMAHAAVPVRFPSPLGRSNLRNGGDSIAADLKRLGVQPDAMNAQSDLNKIRTFTLPRIVNGTASANFFVLLSPDGKVEVKFVSGAESLKPAEKALTRVNYKFVFPDHGPERIANNALLGCYPYSGCSLVFTPPSLSVSVP